VTRDYANFETPYTGEAPQTSNPVQVTVAPEASPVVAPEAEAPAPTADSISPQQHPNEEADPAQPSETQNPVGSVDQTEIVDPPRAKDSGTSLFGRFWKWFGF